MLPMVMGAVILATVLFSATSWVTQQARHRLSLSKHQEAARWLAESGLEVGKARVASGLLGVGEKVEGSFPQGSFEVTVVRTSAGAEVVSLGTAATETHILKAEVSP